MKPPTQCESCKKKTTDLTLLDIEWLCLECRDRIVGARAAREAVSEALHTCRMHNPTYREWYEARQARHSKQSMLQNMTDIEAWSDAENRAIPLAESIAKVVNRPSPLARMMSIAIIDDDGEID